MSISGVLNSTLSQHQFNAPIAPPIVVSPPIDGNPSPVGPPIIFGPPILVSPPVIGNPLPVGPPITFSPPILVNPPIDGNPSPVGPPIIFGPPILVSPPVIGNPLPVGPPITFSPPIIVNRLPIGPAPNSIAQNLRSSNLSSAQQAYATLPQDRHLSGVGSGAVASESSTLLSQLLVSLEA